MDRVQLKNFVLLAQTLNYSAVAKQEFISQPALTKQINRLEEELGVQLFHRTKHDVSLTFAGEEFYRYAVEILDGVERAIHRMENIRRGKTGSLEISSVFGLEGEIAQSVGRYLERFPEVNVSISSGTGAQQVLSINQQSADLFFSFAPLLKLYPSIDTVPLAEDRFAIYTHERYADRIRTHGLSCLDEITHLIEFRSEGGPLYMGVTLSIREALGLSSDNVAYYPSNSTVLIALQAGMGFAFLPSELNFGLCPENVVKLPLDIPEARIQHVLGWNRNNKNAAVAGFVEVVRSLHGSEPGA